MIDEIRDFVSNARQDLKQRLADLDKKKKEPKPDLPKINAEIAKINAQLKRIVGYKLAANGDPLCPDCLMKSGLEIPLGPIPSEEVDIDIFKCRACGETFDKGI